MNRALPLTKDLLRTRARELIVYLRFLRIAVENDVVVTARGDELRLAIDKPLTHMMKANVSLLLYSAMEACIVQLLDEIHETIGKHCHGADQLNDQLVLMVAQHFKQSRVNPTVSNTRAPLHESLFKGWLEDWKQRDQPRKREAGLSGAVDGRAIFVRLRRFGVFPVDLEVPPDGFTDSALERAKDRRNELAHGERSFAEMGQELAYEELCGDALAVFRTLRNIALEVDAFLHQKRYLAPPWPELTEA